MTLGMKLKVFISLVIIFGAAVFLYSTLTPDSKSAPDKESAPIADLNDPKDTPRIEGGYIVTRIKVIPISEVTYVEIVNGTIRYVIIHYEKDKYNGGMMAMSTIDYMKIRKYLNVAEIPTHE